MDTEKTTGAKLPIRDILLSNPEWFRGDLGDLAPLIKSIKESGLHMPVLLKGDLLVIDGARRIAAYEAMGRKEIPVVITNDWDAIIDHLEHTRKTETSGLPFERMAWEDMDTLWRMVIIPLYAYKRVERGLETRRARLRGEDVPYASEVHNNINKSIGRAFGVDPAHVKGVRDLFATLRGIQEDLKPTAAQFKSLIDFIRTTDSRNSNGSFTGLYGTRNVLRGIARGELSFSEAINIIDERERQRSKPRNLVDGWEQNRRRGAPTESDIVKNFCSVISQYGEQAQRLMPGEEGLDTLDLARQLRTAVNRFNALRRRLLESGTDTQGEQEDE